MAESATYEQVYGLLEQHLRGINKPTLNRLTLLVLGIIKSRSASPANIAKALEELGLANATAESIERQVRRIENDPNISVALCFHPMAKERLLWGRPEQLLLVMDPTTQEDKVVMLTVGVWYRGRALPLAWMVWHANQPLEGDRFWQRVENLLDVVASLLPVNIPVIWVADRAFGSPSFIDLITARGWHYIVRVVKTTLCKTMKGICRQVVKLVGKPGRRAKMRGYVFKKQGWRNASVVVLWEQGYKTPLCLVSDLPPDWQLIGIYRRRYPIETLFRDYKSHGWNWEQGQVTDPEHMQRLLIGMALATWVTVYAGTQVADEYLSRQPTGKRRTKPWVSKHSLFGLGLQRLSKLLMGTCQIALNWRFTQWDALNWQAQIHFHHARAFVLGPNKGEPVSWYARYITSLKTVRP
jgi:hypothetical protein